MPIKSKMEQASIFVPAEVSLLGRVFDHAKCEIENEADLEALASRIIAYYRAGITDETELLALLRQPLGRQVGPTHRPADV